MSATLTYQVLRYIGSLLVESYEQTFTVRSRSEKIDDRGHATTPTHTKHATPRDWSDITCGFGIRIECCTLLDLCFNDI